MPLQATSGAASYDATGGGAPVRNFIEDVFSTYLYTGNGSTQTITNGIDLAGKGGLNWTKSRSTTGNNGFIDTVRGLTSFLRSNATNATVLYTTTITSVSSNGYTLGDDSDYNSNAVTYASWTFRKQQKFFDVVTYTGTGANRTIAHNLGSVPGCIIVKRTDTTSAWQVYHRSLANTQYMVLNTTAAVATDATRWNSTTPTDTVFSLGTDVTVNASGGTYVAYLFAHNAGGFGLTGTDNVISCGSTTGGVTSLGFEPQWVLVKNSTTTGAWRICDNMRGMPFANSTATNTIDGASLFPSNAFAEDNSQSGLKISGNSFFLDTSLLGTGTYVYIAIRRGPMRVPTTGTSVLGLNARTGTGAQTVVTGGAGVSDFALIKNRTSVGNPATWATRLTDIQYLSSAATTEAVANFAAIPSGAWTVMDGVTVGTTAGVTNTSGDGYINYLVKRAPNFMDVACYTGTGANRTVPHNLAAVPELMIVKRRDTTGAWQVYSSAIANTEYLVLNTTAAKATGATRWNSTTPTASVFSLGTDATVNASAGTYVAYLFATCPNVSKVGSYTGTGTTLQINCGFTGGARFVLIKRTDSTGDWYYWDTARGIVAGNDPYLLLNGTAAEVTITDFIDPFTTGFELSTTALATVNVSGGTYVFLAIA